MLEIWTYFFNDSFQRYNKALDAKKDRSKSAQGFGPKGTRGGHPNQVIVVLRVKTSTTPVKMIGWNS